MKKYWGKKTGYVLILFSLLIIFFFDILFLGKTLSTSTLIPGVTPNGPYGFSGYKPALHFSYDIGGNAWINEPNPYIIKKTLAEGSLPLWNPGEGLGMPIIGNLNTETFNPLKFFLNIFPSPFFQDIYFILRLFVMGLFTFLFLMEIRISGLASLFGAISFMLSGYSVWWVNLHPLSSIMYIPAFFYFYERWRNLKDRWNPLFLALSIALSIFGGKIPDVIMGLSLLFLYASFMGFKDAGLKGIFIGCGRALIVCITGVLIASPAFLPFLELNSMASPLAKAIRTGSASHSLPILTSISLWQPLLLGWENYLYSSWLQWTPHAMVFYSGVISLLFLIYGSIKFSLIKQTLPFNVFFLLLFLQIYGLLPLFAVFNIPVFSSMNFLKYNSMLYFSMAVISAYSLDSLIKGAGKKGSFFIALLISAGVISLYYHFLYNECPDDVKTYLRTVMFFSLLGIMIIGGLYYFLKGRNAFGIIALGILLFELFLYMPKDHPDRYHPYMEPEFVKLIREEHPYRIIGDGDSIPPIVSSAIGLNDIRGMNVLIQGDYYTFFQNLISFSVPYTNNPDVLVASTSPYADLLGIKHILSKNRLESERIEEALDFNIKSLRWIKFFDDMIDHSIEGGASYGFFKTGTENRFSFFFPMNFKFKTKLRVSEPFIFAGFALKNTAEDKTVKIRITIEGKTTEYPISGGGWHDQWLDISDYAGKFVSIIIEGDGRGDGTIAMSNFGLSPGNIEERVLYERLLSVHKKELDYLEYKGVYEGIHIYKNKNVMERAFVLSDIKVLSSLREVIENLQWSDDFRKTGFITDISHDKSGRFSAILSKEGFNHKRNTIMADENIIIKKYASDEVVIDVESSGGILVLSDFYYPGWKVKVNGREEDVLNVFGVLRGVIIQDGKSEIIFYYKPISFYAGLLISLLTITMWFIYFYYKRRYNSFCNRG